MITLSIILFLISWIPYGTVLFRNPHMLKKDWVIFPLLASFVTAFAMAISGLEAVLIVLSTISIGNTLYLLAIINKRQS